LGRRNGDKLAPLVARYRKGRLKVAAARLDARQEAELLPRSSHSGRPRSADVCIFTSCQRHFPILDTTSASSARSGNGLLFGFLAGREAARLMLPRGKGAIFFNRRDRQPARPASAMPLCLGQGRPAAVAASRRARSSGRKTSQRRPSGDRLGVDTALVASRIKARRRRGGRQLGPGTG